MLILLNKTFIQGFKVRLFLNIWWLKKEPVVSYICLLCLPRSRVHQIFTNLVYIQIHQRRTIESVPHGFGVSMTYTQIETYLCIDCFLLFWSSLSLLKHNVHCLFIYRTFTSSPLTSVSPSRLVRV